jgi:hypothetical protein
MALSIRASSFWIRIAKDLADCCVAKLVSYHKGANGDLSKPVKLAYSLLVFRRDLIAFLILKIERWGCVQGHKVVWYCLEGLFEVEPEKCSASACAHRLVSAGS